MHPMLPYLTRCCLSAALLAAPVAGAWAAEPGPTEAVSADVTQPLPYGAGYELRQQRAGRSGSKPILPTPQTPVTAQTGSSAGGYGQGSSGGGNGNGGGGNGGGNGGGGGGGGRGR